MYEMVNDKEGLHKLFEGCYRDNLHSIWAGQELYRLDIPEKQHNRPEGTACRSASNGMPPDE
jgi:hypothetical protein